MDSISLLLNPRTIAVAGASQQGGRGASVLMNLRHTGFAGDVFALNPRYKEVQGYACYPSIADLPVAVDCLVIAVPADTACELLEQAYAHGVRAAVVLAGGFGEGGHGRSRASRLRSLAKRGMCICGPNCYGVLNVKTGAAASSSNLPRQLHWGPAALVSQSGALSADAFISLMDDRGLGFSYVVSCGNQLGTKIEDYVEYLIADPDVGAVAVIFECLTEPHKLLRIARQACVQRKSLVFFQAGRSAAGKIMVQSHTGALVNNSDILAAFLRRAGIIQVDDYDELIETIELFAIAPRDEALGREVIVLTGSGGDAAMAADALEDVGVGLASLEPATKERIRAALPEFGSVTNPIDGTGAIYGEDPTLLVKLLDAMLDEPGRPLLAINVSARPVGLEVLHRFARTVAEAARGSQRTIVGFQISPLGGPLDREVTDQLHAARVPLLLGTATAMRTLRHLALRQKFWRRGTGALAYEPAPAPGSRRDRVSWDFLAARQSLVSAGIAVVDSELADSAEEAVTVLRRFGGPVAVKAEVPGLLHKSDLGCVRLDCAGENDVREAYRSVVRNARQAGFGNTRRVLIQPMVAGVAEAYAGIINDPQFGPAICFGLGGIFIEILKDTAVEMAPFSAEDAMQMMHRISGFATLAGARGRQRGDIEALAALLVKLSQFAAVNFGRFCALDLNPIIVKPAGKGVVAVDIVIEPFPQRPERQRRSAAGARRRPGGKEER